ncbi:MAG: iron-containing alcohol dehydrogenase family protein [Calditrichaceae bacterium]
MDENLINEIILQTIDEVSVDNSFHFRVPPNTLVGDGISSKIGGEIAKYSPEKVLIVTDKSMVEMNLMAPLLRSFNRQNIKYIVFDKVQSDPTDKILSEGISKVKDENCDFILGFGGGSPIDVAKAIAVFSTNPGAFVAENIKNERLKLAAVPTTAGTGSEVTAISVITNTDTYRKMLIDHPYIIPDMAFIDPRLTLGIPPKITAMTGIDVLSHAIEAYLARSSCTLARALSHRVIRLVGEYLPTAVGYGSNEKARHKMAIASYMAGMAFSNAGLGLAHAMAHQIGAKYKIPHGMSIALVLPAVMRFNLLVRAERIADIAGAFGEKTEQFSIKEAAFKGIDAVQNLIIEIGLPTRLSEISSEKADFRMMAENALADRSILTNPRTAGIDDIIRIYEEIY